MTWRRFPPVGRLAEVALATTAAAAGTLVYRRFFATDDYLLALALACLAGGVTAALGHRRAWIALPSAVAGLAVIMIWGVFGGSASAVLSGLDGSWNRLLTVAAPADARGELLAAPTLVAWAVAFSSVVLVLRTRNALAPILPPLAGFLFALLTVGNQAGAHPLATAVFLVTALALIAVRTHRGTADGAVRIERQSSRQVVALVTAAGVVAAGTSFGVLGGRLLPLASGEHRFDPRDVLAPPVVRIDTLTPLSQLKKQLNESPPRPLFTVRTTPDSATHLDRVRTAALDTFDGTTWTANGTYRVAGSHLTVDPALQHRRPVTAHVELQELAGPYLPVIGWPSRLDAPGETGSRFGFDPDSGVVVSTVPTSPGFGYDVTGETYVEDKDLAQAATTTPRSPPLPPGVPEAVRTLAASVAERNGPFARARLSSLESALQVMDHRLNGPPGHSYAAIARALAGWDVGGGYAEQYAAAFTVIARMLGYPARVAVGYRLRSGEDGVFQVTTADAHAWSEVHFEGYGWVAYDPSRNGGDITRNPPPEAPRVVAPQPSPSTTTPVPAPRLDSSRAAAPGERGFRWDDVLDVTLLLGPAVVLLGLLAGGLVVLGKTRRRRKRRDAPDHAARVLGAWREQLDRLIERGVSPPVSLTFHEVAQHARDTLGDASNPIAATAELATTAIYAPEHLDRQDADRAWELVALLDAELYPGRLSAARLRAALNPRPLWTSWTVARRRRHAGENLETGRYR